MQLILKDETVIDLMPESIGHTHLVVACASKTAFIRIWSKLSAENLEEVTIQEDGETIETVAGMSIAGTQTHNLDDGTMIGHFYMTGGVPQFYVTLDEDAVFPEDPEEDEGPVSDQEDEGEPEDTPEESEGETE